ncbi:MAG TPA: hypothetical protein PKC24_04560 [Cyclobacteriaceae bacterium]|nr:hypothetical protein [Cyclobacteriaceae bacterium]
MNKQVLWLACMLLSSIASFAQTNDSTLYRVETKDGNEYVGYIVWQDADEIRLQTERLGTISIKKIDIRQMRPASTKQIKSGELWFENPQSTRYLWQPNGYGLKRGEAYFQNIWVFF